MSEPPTRYVAASLLPDLVADKYIGPLPRSVQTGTNADLVHAFRDVYFRADRRIVDLTHGTAGGWWTRYRPPDLTVSPYDFRCLPYADGEYDTVCYDPPYVATGGAATDPAVDGFRDRFGINDIGRSASDLLALVLAGLAEAARITRRGSGFLCVKCMDFTSGGLRDWSYQIHRAAIDAGMRLHDEIIHHTGPGPGGHNIAAPKRARRAHSKLLVFTWPP